MRTLYHEFESLEHLLTHRLLPGGSVEPIRFVVFGGTGAVGGASVIELCRLILMSKSLRERPLRGEIYATGMRDKDIVHFAGRLYLSLGDEVKIDKIEPRRHYRFDDRIDLKFDTLELKIPRDLEDHVREEVPKRGPGADVEAVVDEYFRAQGCPFLRYVEELNCGMLHAVAVAIPLPSVATYALETIERLKVEHGLDAPSAQRIKSSYLRTFIRGLAEIQQLHARRVLIAHTTGVGGMYRVDGGNPVIRMGFSHSALGKKLAEKRFFANELTQLYLDHGFDVLVTAAAIGIDAVDFHCRLPASRAVQNALAARVKTAEKPMIPVDDLMRTEILHYPFETLDLDAPDGVKPLDFGPGKDFLVDAAIRSGENGLFSVANCVALYNVMKVSIPEELAMVLVRRAVFGPERRADWFHSKVCYYHETENSYFALRLLDNYPQLVRGHHSPFEPQAFQALGSATHQARLHQLGILMLLLRLRELGGKFEEIPEEELTAALAHDLDDFFWERTRIPAFEDLDGLDAETLGGLLGKLCEADSMEAAGYLLGFDARAHGLREPGRERFLARLATRIRRYLEAVTSLGIPIVYRGSDGVDRILAGPYVAPLDIGIADGGDLRKAWKKMAADHGTTYEAARDWTIVNNGFVDLRPHALVSVATEAGPRLADQIHRFSSTDELVQWFDSLDVGSYFTTGGLVSVELRLGRLFERLRQRKIQLGTRETWKHLFQMDAQGRHLISPGLVETIRMYSEGLGKITGTEALWPGWGY